MLNDSFISNFLTSLLVKKNKNRLTFHEIIDKSLVIGTAAQCGTTSMKRYGVRPSVCSSVAALAHSREPATAGLLLWARQQISIDCCSNRGANAVSAMFSAYVVKVKFSHTRYRALGPELIPVYRQSARR